jgi:rfaE bifunctional protein nucleotidyltransferase chain/domain
VTDSGGKVLDLREVARAVEQYKAAGRRVVQCHGVFDLLHPGHIRHFQAARREGDVLVVTVTPDRHVNKGPGRPAFDERLRAESVAALEAVDHVAINEWATAVETIRLLQPDVYAKGDEYAGRDRGPNDAIAAEEQAVGEVGGRMHYTSEATFSSSALLNAHFGLIPTEARGFLEGFRARYSAADVLGALESLRATRVVVVGEPLVDEYCFCRAYGMASKSSSIAVQEQSVEQYAGGAAVVANHLAGFCDEVELVGCLGEANPLEDFFRSRLRPNVVPSFHYRRDAPTAVKRRYVHEVTATKLFEVSRVIDLPLEGDVERAVRADVQRRTATADLVVAADFGLGQLTSSVVEALARHSRFLAITAKTNAMNVGYNRLTRYPRADYAAANAQEARLALGDQRAPLESASSFLLDALQAQVVSVTRGQHGALVERRDAGVAAVPSLTRDVVDPVGAGDAFLAVAAPLANAGAPPDLIGFVGNAAAALAVRVVGNKEPVDNVHLVQFVTTLLK